MTTPANPTPAALAALDELQERLTKHEDAAREHRLPIHSGCLVVRAEPLAALLAAARRGAGDTAQWREELQRVATECGHPELWESAAEVVRGKLMHYDELEAKATHYWASWCSTCGARTGTPHPDWCRRDSDPRSNGSTIGHEPNVLPQGMTFHAGELGDAYVAGAKSGRDHQPTDEQIARACDAYVKCAHLQRTDAARAAHPEGPQHGE